MDINLLLNFIMENVKGLTPHAVIGIIIIWYMYNGQKKHKGRNDCVDTLLHNLTDDVKEIKSNVSNHIPTAIERLSRKVDSLEAGHVRCELEVKTKIAAIEARVND